MHIHSPSTLHQRGAIDVVMCENDTCMGYHNNDSMIGFLCILFAIPLALFPALLPGTTKLKQAEARAKHLLMVYYPHIATPSDTEHSHCLCICTYM
jgi:hypothetical protein